MTYNVLVGTLNPTHSLTHSLFTVLLCFILCGSATPWHIAQCVARFVSINKLSKSSTEVILT